jgi:hypothetical protein
MVSTLDANRPSGGLLELVRSEPRKAAVLGTLLSVMGLLWVKVLFVAPPPAEARPAAATPGKTLAAADESGSALSAARRQLLVWGAQPTPPLKRNLFQVQYDLFPPDESGRVSAADQGAFWEQIAKSLDFRSDQEVARTSLKQELRKRAGRLRPTATINANGGRTALIEGRLVGEGDVVEGFRVLQIATDRIVVEREGVRLEVMTQHD